MSHERFDVQITKGDEVQYLLQRVTGNFKRGNERPVAGS